MNWICPLKPLVLWQNGAKIMKILNKPYCFNTSSAPIYVLKHFLNYLCT